MDSTINDVNEDMMHVSEPEEEECTSDNEDHMLEDKEDDQKVITRNTTQGCNLPSTSMLLTFTEKVEQMAAELRNANNTSSFDERLIQSKLQSLNQIKNTLCSERTTTEKYDFTNEIIRKNNSSISTSDSILTQSYQLLALKQEVDRVYSLIEDKLHRQTLIEKAERDKSQNDTIKEKFRDYYMSTVTDTFGDDLEQLRQQEELDEHKLALLIDSLETGQDTFSDLAKQLTVNYYA
ncbi:hypothetical protein BDF22DRAFT_676792 [Syncephalis plumigaleata]|nr:hypothetical protein BDF22DRAFT_676792 [Syncephalis plumigaleata]